MKSTQINETNRKQTFAGCESVSMNTICRVKETHNKQVSD
jgi:hypothetical protein